MKAATEFILKRGDDIEEGSNKLSNGQSGAIASRKMLKMDERIQLLKKKILFITE